jgi:V8-like Glu-specific endopeptidase
MESAGRRWRTSSGRRRPGRGKPRRRRAVAAAIGSLVSLLVIGALAAAFARLPHARPVADGTAAAGVPGATAPWTPERMMAATPGTPTGSSPTQPATTAAHGPAADESAEPATDQAPRPSASPQAPAADAPVRAAAVKPEPATAMTPYPSARPFDGTPAVGVLFYTDKSLAAHYCTASVVHSPAGDVVITAAHCVYGSDYKTGFAFVPGYHDGQSPYGQWTPAQTIVSAGWRASNDPDEDVAFLVMGKSAAGRTIESVVGADQIAFGQGVGQTVTVPAYPAGSPTPVTCTDVATAFSGTQLRWDCAGYPGGTSGAPFLVGGDRGTVVGVIGGYETGGDTPDVSYSSFFGDAVAGLYQQAVAAG